MKPSAREITIFLFLSNHLFASAFIPIGVRQRSISSRASETTKSVLHIATNASTEDVKEKNKTSRNVGKEESNYLLDEFRTADGYIVDPYQILQVDRNAELGYIKRQYRALSKIYHPDSIRHLDTLPGECQDMNDARDEWEKMLLSYTILSDRRLRLRYDRNSELSNTIDTIGHVFEWGFGNLAKAAKTTAKTISVGIEISKKVDEAFQEFKEELRHHENIKIEEESDMKVAKSSSIQSKELEKDNESTPPSNVVSKQVISEEHAHGEILKASTIVNNQAEKSEKKKTGTNAAHGDNIIDEVKNVRTLAIPTSPSRREEDENLDDDVEENKRVFEVKIQRETKAKNTVTGSTTSTFTSTSSKTVSQMSKIAIVLPPSKDEYYTPLEACSIIYEHELNPALDKPKAIKILLEYEYVPVKRAQLYVVYNKFKEGEVKKSNQWRKVHNQRVIAASLNP